MHAYLLALPHPGFAHQLAVPQRAFQMRVGHQQACTSNCERHCLQTAPCSRTTARFSTTSHMIIQPCMLQAGAKAMPWTRSEAAMHLKAHSHGRGRRRVSKGQKAQGRSAPMLVLGKGSKRNGPNADTASRLNRSAV